jgi:hypothetical protein
MLVLSKIIWFAIPEIDRKSEEEDPSQLHLLTNEITQDR